MVIGLTGCVEKQIILVPQTEYYPTFDISEFQESKPYSIYLWADVDDTNGTVDVSLCSTKDEMLGLFQNTKELRAKYNVLLKELRKFNEVIKDINLQQKEKQPKEVDTIDDSWLK
jgi:hypothetical protein